MRIDDDVDGTKFTAPFRHDVLGTDADPLIDDQVIQ